MLPPGVLPTATEAEAIHRSFARRQIGILALSAIALGGLIAATAISRWTLLLQIAFVALAAVVTLGSILIWRCPRCSEPFGRNWLVRQCPHCFAELTTRDP